MFNKFGETKCWIKNSGSKNFQVQGGLVGGSFFQEILPLHGSILA